MVEQELTVKTFFRNVIGRISKGQVERFIFFTTSGSVDGEIGLHEQRETAQGFSAVVGESVGEMQPLIIEIFWAKKERNLSHFSGVASNIWPWGR